MKEQWEGQSYNAIPLEIALCVDVCGTSYARAGRPVRLQQGLRAVAVVLQTRVVAQGMQRRWG